MNYIMNKIIFKTYKIIFFKKYQTYIKELAIFQNLYDIVNDNLYVIFH